MNTWTYRTCFACVYLKSVKHAFAHATKLPQSRSECEPGAICSQFLCQRPGVQRRRQALGWGTSINEQLFYTHTHTHQHIQTSAHWQILINEVIGCSISLHHLMALLRLSPHPALQSLSPFAHALSRPFPATHPCVGGRLESPESTTRITRSISETISFSHLFYMACPSVSLSSLPLSFTCTLWLISVFTVCPSSHSSLLGI